MPMPHPVLAALIIVGYVGAQIAVGLWIGRRVKSSTDYFVAGRRLGPLPIALSLFATWFGAETVLGSSAAIAGEGLSGARAEPFGYAICLTAMAFLIAVPFRKRGYITLADFFRDRFDRSNEIAAAVITVLVSVIWAAAQLLALSAILSVALGLPAFVTLVAAAIVVVVYASFGGLASDVATDMIQGAVLLVGLLAVLVALAFALGGLGDMLGLISPAQLRLLGPGENPIQRLDAWAIPILGSLVTQEAIARFAGARDVETAKRGCLGAAGLYLAAGAIPVLLGLAGAHVVGVDQGDEFLPRLVQQVLSPIWSILLMAALLSAILSTVDSNILSVSALVTTNLGKLSGNLTAARLVTAGAGALALAIAATGATIYDLVELTSALGQAGLLVAVLIGLFSRWGGPHASMAAILACALINLATYVLYPVWAGDADAEFPGGFLLSVLVSILAYAAAAEWERRRASKTQPA